MNAEAIEIQSQKLIQSYLATATRAQWHLFVARSNYDSNQASLRWLVDNPDTDKGTVLQIYWNLGAAWYVQFSSEEESKNPELFQLLRLIEERYSNDYYRSGDIWFDPAHSDGGGPGDYPDIPVRRPIPENMLKPLIGSEYVEVDADPAGFDEGLPLEVVDALYALHDEA